VQIAFRSKAMNRHVPASVALCLFRIAQEALQNVVKHSGATAATVRLRMTGSGIGLHIADGGGGFNQPSNHGTGLGLLSMRERVHFAAGRIVIRSAAARETHIVIYIPLDQDTFGTADIAPVTPLRASDSLPCTSQSTKGRLVAA
jgi:signal transduction histidine kinase